LLDIDQLALVEYHAVGIVALAFAVVAAGELFAAVLNELRACDTVSRT
jgi:hypothetical protein